MKVSSLCEELFLVQARSSVAWPADFVGRLHGMWRDPTAICVRWAV